jgi:hypothetical protein
MPKKTKDLTKQAHSGAKYVGDGSFMVGIPQRDLSQAEWDAVTPDIQDALIDRKSVV